MKFEKDISAPMFKEAKRETPDYLGQTLAIVPLSIGVGLVVLIGGALICWGLKQPARAALVAGGFVMSGAAIYAFLRIWADELYMSIETITGHDWNQDGFIGDPIPENRVVTIEITNPDNNSLQYLQIPGHLYDKLPMIAHLLTVGKPFSEGAMTGGGRPLTRSEFHQLRDLFFARGLARWRNEQHPTQGIELTAYGKGIMRRVRDERTTHARMRTQGVPAALPERTEGSGMIDKIERRGQ